MKHTPGPWEIFKTRSNSDLMFHIKSVNSTTGFPMNVAALVGKNDAPLICAAPDLLAACESAIQIIEQLIPEPSARGVAGVVLFQLRVAVAIAKSYPK